MREKSPIRFHATAAKVVEMLNRKEDIVTVRGISDKFISKFTGNDPVYDVTKQKLRKTFLVV